MNFTNLFISITVFFIFNIGFCKDISCLDRWEKWIDIDQLSIRLKELYGLCNEELKRGMKDKIDENDYLDYYNSRMFLFSDIYNKDGIVCGVYSNKCIKTNTIPDYNVMNCEHTWPQSMGAVGIAKSDLHHLFPTLSIVNSRRGNLSFGNVSVSVWNKYGTMIGYNEIGNKIFEPRNDHKGNVARSMFYFSVRYGKNIDNEEEEVLRNWIYQDPVSSIDVRRDHRIYLKQGNHNPFVIEKNLVMLIDNF